MLKFHELSENRLILYLGEALPAVENGDFRETSAYATSVVCWPILTIDTDFERSWIANFNFLEKILINLLPYFDEETWKQDFSKLDIGGFQIE